MEPRLGKVVNGAIVLENCDDLVEGSDVTIWIGDSHEPVSVEGEEIELIDEGQEAASRAELLDAREFLEQLRCAR